MIKAMHHTGRFLTIDGWPSYCIRNNKIYCYVIDSNNIFYVFIGGMVYEAEQTQFSFPLLALLPAYENVQQHNIKEA